MPTLLIKEALTFLEDAPFDALVSHTYGWKVLGYTSLRRRTRVGENRPIPGGSPPRIFVPREWDEMTAVLTWRINGRYEPDGTPYADPFDGVDLNHQIILDNVVNNLGLRAVTFEDRHGVEFAGDLVVDNWEPVEDPNSGGDVLIAPMTLKILGGWLEPTGS